MTSKCKTQCGKNKIYSVKIQTATCTVQCEREKKKNLCSSRLSRSRFALSRAYDVMFGLSTLITNRISFHNLCEIEFPASGTQEHDQRRGYADVPFPRATKEIGDVCTQAKKSKVPTINEHTKFSCVHLCIFYLEK